MADRKPHRALAVSMALSMLAACSGESRSGSGNGNGGGSAASAAHPTKPLAGRDGGAGTRDAGPYAGAQDDDAGSSMPKRCGVGTCDLRDANACSPDQGCVFAVRDPAMEPSPSAQCLPAGAGHDGDACTSYLDCGAGLACTTTDGSGVCRRYCCELNKVQGCPSGQFCGIALQDGRGGISDVGLCEVCAACDLRDASPCGAGFGCYVLPGVAGCRTCLPAGAAAPGATCTLSTDCRAGTACFALETGVRQCLAFCDLKAAPSACAPGQKCKSVGGAELPADTGLCLAP